MWLKNCVSIHVKFSALMNCNFRLRKNSSIGWSRMERSLKQGKNLQWQEIRGYICQWRGWWDHVPRGQGLHAQHTVIALVRSRLCRSWSCSMSMSDGAKESSNCCLLMGSCVVLLSFNDFSLCLLSSSKKRHRHHWSSYFITLHSVQKPCLKRHYYLHLIS